MDSQNGHLAGIRMIQSPVHGFESGNGGSPKKIVLEIFCGRKWFQRFLPRSRLKTPFGKRNLKKMGKNIFEQKIVFVGGPQGCQIFLDTKYQNGNKYTN
jgi:hypothetical protein